MKNPYDKLIKSIDEITSTKIKYIFVTNNGYNSRFLPAERFNYVMEYAGSVGVPPSNIFITVENRVQHPGNASWLNHLLHKADGGTSDSMSIHEFVTEHLGEESLSECVLFCDSTFHISNRNCEEFSHIYMFVENREEERYEQKSRETFGLPHNVTVIVMSDKDEPYDNWRVL